jgi:hypothetical protein
MRALLWIALAAGAAALLLRFFLKTPPADLARRLRIAGGVALLLVAVGLVVLRQFALAVPVGFAGYIILRRQAGVRRMGPVGPSSSSVRSAGLDMGLDHETGEMDGEVLAGRHAGRRLSDLQMRELLEVGDDLKGDAESLRLLESYLDRRHPGWRDDVEADPGGRQRPPVGAGRMSTQEAYEILGLAPGADEAEVREAHRRLMKQVHPDRGGSSALAAKINEAKDRILGRHR